MPSLIKLDMEFSLVIELKLVVVDTGYFVGLTPVENSQLKLGKPWDKFTPEMKQGVWVPKTLHKEDPTHSSWKEELWVSRFIHLSFVASYLSLEPC